MFEQISNIFRRKKINYVYVESYVDKEKCFKLVSMKETEIGYDVISEPYSFHDSDVFHSMSHFIMEYLQIIQKQPFEKSTNSNRKKIFNELLNGKSYKRFCEEHILISIRYVIKDKYYEVSNYPKIPKESGYGVTKDTLSEHYSTKYICHNQQEIQEAIEKAYEEGLAYLEAIGEPLKDPSDNKNTNKSSKSDKSSNSNRINTNKEFTT